MTRKEFIKVCGLLGISIPLQSVTSFCSRNDNGAPTGFNGSVLIIGAGAAGMSLGYLLAQQGIDYQILEASSTYGGRIKHNTSFADFPIPLGAEWLHVNTSELTNIVNDSSKNITTITQGYLGSNEVGHFNNGVYTTSSLATAFGNIQDRKFVNSSWLDFFETFVVPSIASNFQFNVQITAINYQSEKVIVTDSNRKAYEADKVIVTVPLKILQRNVINFTPSLPSLKLRAIENAPVWGGLKVFIEFTAKFYPVYLTFPDSDTSAGQRLYYDAAYAQNSSKNILGLFAVGMQAEQYQNLSGIAQRDYILNELDAVFNGMATQNYINHIVQNWNDESYIQAAYLADNASSSISSRLSSSVENKLYFAGDAYTQEDDWGGVHNATRSARDVFNEIT